MSIVLQVCAECGTVNYPNREVCRNCLGERLEPTALSGRGVLLAGSLLHASADPLLRERLPWRIGTARLDAGATLIVHLGNLALDAGAVVELTAADQNGVTVFTAGPALNP